MNLPKLRERLSLCAEYVREGSRLADIGTDHGYLPIALCLCGRIPSALACDINPLPLRSADANISSAGLRGCISTRLSDGLKGIKPDEADDIVIAGMGGELIASILSYCPWIKDPSKNLVLQPMTRHEVLIRWLYKSGFIIIRQGAVRDSKKYYTVIQARYTGEIREPDALTAYIGLLRPDSEAAEGFLNKCLDKLRKQSIGDPSLISVTKELEELLT